MDKDVYFNYDWKCRKEDIKYCPRCGSRFELMELIVPGKKYFVCHNCNFIFYLDPKLVVVALVVNAKNEVLLLKRNEEPSKGLWGLPGGYVERGDSIYKAIEDEVFEEAGIHINVTNILISHTLGNNETIQIAFKATCIQDSIKTNIESSDAKFFSEKEIPWNELAFPTTTEIIKLYYSNKNE